MNAFCHLWFLDCIVHKAMHYKKNESIWETTEKNNQPKGRMGEKGSMMGGECSKHIIHFQENDFI